MRLRVRASRPIPHFHKDIKGKVARGGVTNRGQTDRPTSQKEPKSESAALRAAIKSKIEAYALPHRSSCVKPVTDLPKPGLVDDFALAHRPSARAGDRSGTWAGCHKSFTTAYRRPVL